MNDPQRLLRNSLRANGVFSALSGAIFALGAGPLARAFGLGEALILMGVGVGLLGFAGLLAFLQSRPTIPLPTAMQIVWADLAWVIGTIPLLLLGVLNRTGAIAAIAVADVVLLLALLQYLGVRRVRYGFRGTAASATN